MSSQEDLTNSNSLVPSHLGVVSACLFIVGEIAGTGILALPDALKSTGWTGLLSILFICMSFAFCAILLGKCWLIIEQRDPSLASCRVRNAFPLIGERAGGSVWKTVTTISFIIQMFGGAVVVTLILAEIVERLAKQISLSMTFCNWIIVVALVLLPFTFLGSPADFKPAAFFAMSSTSFAALLLVIEIIRQKPQAHADASSSLNQSMTGVPVTLDDQKDDFQVTMTTYISGLCTMAFAFAGASAMPTFQQDMRDRSKFTLAAAVGFALLLFIYLPVSIAGYICYGNDLQENIFRNLNASPLTTAIDLLMALHIFCAFLIIVNPVNLWIEDKFNIRHSFNLPRCFSRTVVHGVLLACGLSIPRFGKLLNLVGASCVSLQSVILPCVFYYKLQTADESRVRLSMAMKGTLQCLVFIYMVLAIVGTVLSLGDIFSPSTFTQPCWISNCDK